MAKPGESGVMGRPLIAESPEKFAKGITEYVKLRVKAKMPLTVAGLCHHLGFATRQSFYDYEQRPDYSYLVKRARLLIEDQHESIMIRNGAVAGSIFWLKNHGWSDTKELHHSGEDGGPIKITEVVIHMEEDEDETS